MPITKVKKKSAALDCISCQGQCCRYFALQIDTPRTLEDYDHLRWYIAHESIALFIEDKEWYMQVNNKCKHLQDDFKCGMYEERPQICRDYGWDESGDTECHGVNSATDHDIFFSDLKELEAYLVEKGKRWASLPLKEFRARRACKSC
ncbi:YkgJ family cysteine cluster protein [bacterium]|nr:YkgJ family cysteine cluster protein [bacterium]